MPLKLALALALGIMAGLLTRPAEAGRFATLISITVATTDADDLTDEDYQVDGCATLVSASRPLLRVAAAPVLATKKAAARIVCGPNGCRVVASPPATSPLIASPECESCDTSPAVERSIVVRHSHAIVRRPARQAAQPALAYRGVERSVVVRRGFVRGPGFFARLTLRPQPRF